MNSFIGFQVKSYDDLRHEQYMQILKAQRDDSFRAAGLSYYFILLCTDAGEHKDKVRNIAAVFHNADRTEVSEPQFVYTFLNHPKTRVEALVKRTMEAEDYVFRAALESLDFESPSARALAVFLSVRNVMSGQRDFALGEISQNQRLRDVYSELREKQAALIEAGLDEAENSSADDVDEEEEEAEYDEFGRKILFDQWGLELVELDEFEPQLASDLDHLAESVLEVDRFSELVKVAPDQLRPLNAVVADALVRYEYNEEQLLLYMFSAMGVRD